jgi:hypothetical protein
LRGDPAAFFVEQCRDGHADVVRFAESAKGCLGGEGRDRFGIAFEGVVVATVSSAPDWLPC